MAKEKLYENQIKRYLQSVGVYALGTPKHKMTVDPVGYYEKRHGSVFTKSGLPDLHICIHGKSIEAEIKAENGKPSELQLFMVEQINMSGGCAVIIYPRHFDMFKELVETYL